MNAGQLVSLVPPAAHYAQAFFDSCKRWEIETITQVNAFLANVIEETNGFRRMHECFDYRPEALTAVFRGRITPDEALWLGRKKGEAMVPLDRQQLIANKVYALRHGNRDESSGDGWLFRGRGGFQLTFLDAYMEFSHVKFGDERLVENPDLVASPELAMESAAWYFVDEGGLTLAEDGHFDEICRRINPALAGIDARRAWFKRLTEETA